MSGYVLDTTVVIDYAQGIRAGEEIVQKLFGENADLYICDVVTCEAMSRGGSGELAAVAALLDALEFIALPPHGAVWAGNARRAQIEAGRRKPGTADALVAAVAHALNATVVTRNAKDFEAFDVPVLGYGQPPADG